MLKRIDGLPDGVIGFEAVGKVEASDYEDALDPAVEAAVAAHGRVRFLFVLGHEYEGYAPGAIWQDATVGFGERKAWERIALVTDHERLLEVVGLFARIVPGEVRTFHMDGYDEAVSWLGEPSHQG